jgi:hypothetical protein
MGFQRRFGHVGLAMAGLALAAGCGGGEPGGSVVRTDAQFDPPSGATAFRPLNEANPAVAQTFTVLQDGLLEEFWIVVTDGESADSGTLRISVQPVDGDGVIDDDLANSIIDPILVNTSTLPEILIDSFTEFDIGTEPGREVVAGERYAIVVEAVSRATRTDTLAIARVLGQLPSPGDPYTGGTGATGELGDGFTNNTEDYFFRTFVLD